MDADLPVALIEATVQIDQPVSAAKRMVGTAFLISATDSLGAPQIVLVTAAHVFERMPGLHVRVGWRIAGSQGMWNYTPSYVPIRGNEGPLWYQHPTQDIAVLPVKVPESYKRQALPVSVLATERTLQRYRIGVGTQMMTLGFPQGLSSNSAGFPILRSGYVASYPVHPISRYPTFLIDLTAVPGNSGGPVFVYSDDGNPANDFVAGVLIKQVEDGNERLELGVVTGSVYVRETIDLMVQAKPVSSVAAPASATGVSPEAEAGSVAMPSAAFVSDDTPVVVTGSETQPF